MINVWEFQDEKKVRLTDIDGQVFIGPVVDVTDAEEQSEDYGFGESSITVFSAGKHVEIPQSEIRSIEILN